MTNYREILRLDNLGINKTNISVSCECSRNTVLSVLQRAKACDLKWPLPDNMSNKDLAEKLYLPGEHCPVYKMPNYEYVHREMQKNGVTLKLLWLEYCDLCRTRGEIPYQSILQYDNLKTGVDKNTRSEVTLNITYQELAEHYGMTVVPCRI